MTAQEEVFGIALSSLDQERFGCITAKAFVTRQDEIFAAIEFCTMHEVEFLIIRCPTDAYAAMQSLSGAGMRLLDTLVYYEWHTDESPLPDLTHDVRPLAQGEETQVSAIAKEAFQNYPGHYYLDPKLDRRKTEGLYQDWAERACRDKAMADHVFVAHAQNEVAGFLTLKIHGDSAEITLNAIAKRHQGKGVYRSLVAATFAFAKEQKLKRVFVSSQLTNVAVQKTWMRCGMEPYRSCYTFHHWFK